MRLFLGWHVLLIVTAFTAAAEFPGATSSRSWDKTYVITNRDAENSSEIENLGGNHALYLRKVGASEEKRIYSYNRFVSVSWSPKSQQTAITDFVGSDRSICCVYRISEGKLIRLEPALSCALEKTQEFRNHHVYAVATAWKNDQLLKIKVHGYGESNKSGFAKECIYDTLNDFVSSIQ